MDVSLSNDDISEYLGNKVNILRYDQLNDYSNIDDVLDPYGRAVILYFWKAKPCVGHWTCVFKTPRNTIEFFNSYGTVPDKTLNDIPLAFKKSHGEDFKTLTKLLYDSGYEIEYNDKCLQQNDSSVCGRYCILRLCCEDIPIEQFQKLFTKNKKRNDELVLQLIN